MTTYGVLGVGSIASAIVIGLCEGVTDPPTLVLSPRNAERSSELAARFDTVRIAEDNQAVVDAADVVIVCLLPEHTADELGALRFRGDQQVVSAVAGVDVATLGDLVAPVEEIARSIPQPSVAARVGSTPVHPATPSAVGLFDALGGSLHVDLEPAFDSLSAASATVAAHFRYLDAIATWVATQGLDEAAARRYVADLFVALADELTVPDLDFAELAAAHSTPGGLNAQFARRLADAGTYDTVASGLDELLARVAPRR